MGEPSLCGWGCGQPFVAARAGQKGHFVCYSALRGKEAAAKRAVRAACVPPPVEPSAPSLCRWCNQPYASKGNGVSKGRGHAVCYRDSLKSPQVLESLVTPSGGFAESVRAVPRQHPHGWDPHVEENGNTATAVSQPMEESHPDEEMLIRGWNLDPTQWRIVGPLNCRRWQASIPVEAESSDCKCAPVQSVRHHELRWQHYFRANMERREPLRDSQLAEIIEEIRTHVPLPGPYPTGEDSFVVSLADVQMGKADGDGTTGTVARLLASIESTATRIEELRALGRRMGTLYVFGMGDLIESCESFYAQQTFRVELNLRDQVKSVRRIVLKSLERWSPMFERVVVGCVGGNHGELRRDGKSFTDFADNFDVTIFEQVAEICEANPAAYGHVSFAIPKDQLSLTFDISGEIVGITHGHVAGKGGGENVAKRIRDWWMKQGHGQQAIGDARILLTAHYHHLLVSVVGSKTHIQCPAMEGGSDWWENQTGQKSPSGLLTVRIGKDVSPMGWGDLAVL